MKRRKASKKSVIKKKQKIYIGIFIVVVLAVGVWALENYMSSPNVCINGKCFKMEIADTEAEKILGLSERESLKENEGMIFVFSEPDDWGFWMHEMSFPLDIIWVDSEGIILAIGENLEPCPAEGDCPIYYSGGQAKYVLEINGGLSEKYGFEIEDLVLMKK